MNVINELPFSPAAERNRQPIFLVIEPYLRCAESALEIGSGTAQHAVYFAAQCPNLKWQTTDQAPYLAGIRAQLKAHGLPNLPEPIEVDVNSTSYAELVGQYDFIYSANTLHIMDPSSVENFFSGLGRLHKKQTVLALYGPFKIAGEFTSASNAQFDMSLRARGEGSAIRDKEWIEQLALQVGFTLAHDIPMPANNQCLIFKISRQDKVITTLNRNETDSAARVQSAPGHL